MLPTHRCSSESQMMHGGLEKDVFFLMHCIIHQWFFFCDPGREQWSLCWSENNRECRHKQQRKENKRLACTGERQSSPRAARGMKGGNAAVSSGSYSATASLPSAGPKWPMRLKWRCRWRRAAEWATDHESSGRVRMERSHADHATHGHRWSGRGRQAPARCRGLASESRFPPLTQSRTQVKDFLQICGSKSVKPPLGSHTRYFSTALLSANFN